MRALRLVPDVLTTPEIRSIQAQRMKIDSIFGQVRELMADRHAARLRGDSRREIELDAQIAYLRGERA